MSHLFSETRIDQLVLNRMSDAREYVKRLSEDSILGQFDDHLEYLCDKHLFQMVELVGEYQTDGPAIVDVEAPRGGYYDSPTVRGVGITVEQQFEGDSDLLRVTPSTLDHNPPRAWADDSRSIIYISVETIEQSPVKLKQQINDQVNQIQKYLGWLLKDVQEANSSLRSQIEGLLLKRKAEAEKRRQFEADLGIKLKPREGPASKVIPLQKKRRLAAPPSVAASDVRESKPSISEDDYNYILDVCKGMGIMMERAASSFTSLEEEDLRHVFLAALNTHFEGQASAEAFNMAGKTDILIRSKEHNVFIAECKNWKGAQSLSDAITQVLGYLTWRDTKAAILVFNRDIKDFTKIVDQIPEIIRGHEAFDTMQLESSEAARFQCRLKKVEDEAIKIDLTILAFHLPKKTK
ncbi:MAG: hypothetical protein J5I53_08975 [Bradyrhizobiaceae bacterium]|nr:hypothetical protein [Bradyrhizobiaceae bacterium]